MWYNERFKDYYCRICKRSLCCVPCRLKHEINQHDVHPECDICIYGKTYISDLSESLLLHIEERHWPLHCVKCQKLYKTIDELKIHTKCTFGKEAVAADQDPITPVRVIVAEATDETFESPPVMNTIKKYSENSNIVIKYSQNTIVTTSTPTQDEGNNGIQSVSFVSPIDTVIKIANEIKKVAYMKTEEVSGSNSAVLPVETLTELDSIESKNTPMNAVLKVQSMKRKVTFSAELNSTRQITETESISAEGESDNNAQEISEELERSSGEPNSETQSTHNKTTITSVEINNTFWTTATELSSISGFQESRASTSSTTDNDCDFTSPEGKRRVVKVNKSTGIWWSMANLVKTFMHGLSGSSTSLNQSASEVINCQPSLKRGRTDSDVALDDIRVYKKIKLTDIKSRKPIHTLTTPYRVIKKRVRMCDKSTQTD